MNASITTTLLSLLLVLSSLSLDASQLPVKVGSPIRISPKPGPANPDPVLENLPLVMDNHYKPPFYPGGTPDYLSQIYFWSNYYIINFLNFNPCNDNFMHVGLGQNMIFDFTFTYPSVETIVSSAFGSSTNRGRTWSFGPPIEQIIPLGGDISQIINFSLGPGLRSTYGKNGRLYAGGWGFFDMNPIPPNPVAQNGFLFTTSEDDGKHWAPRKIELASDIMHFFGLPSRPGVGPREWGITPSPFNPDLIHADSMFTLQQANNTFFGNAFYNRSENGGRTFSPFKQVYSMIDDPVWRSKFFDPTFPDPTYFVYGGWSLLSALPLPFDDNILMLPTMRIPFPPFTSDLAVIKSSDNGKTWSRIAGATDTFLTPFYIYDPGFPIPNAGEIVNGFLSFPFFFDSNYPGSTPLVSPLTGRLYLTWEAWNPAFSETFTTGVNVMQVLLSSSSDGGDTFSPNVQINRTPTDIIPPAQQAFAHGAAFTQDGYYCVAYYDFRNWTGFPGEDIANTPLQTDAWMDVYKETVDPRGGSTGVGLDFVGEIRLTKKSFDSRIINLTPTPPYRTNIITGTPEGIVMIVNNNNELFVVYSEQTGEGVSPSNVSIGFKGMTIDTNPYITCFLQRFKFANASNQ